MTISLEEHVARAKREEKLSKRFKRWMDGDDEFAGRWDFNKILRALQRLERIDRAAIAAVREYEGALTKDERRQFAINFVHEGQRPADPAEAMRAKCEEIAREMPGWQQPRDVADAIAALKDNGERK